MFTGIFSMFSRSRELRQFDRELRDAGLHQRSCQNRQS